MDHLDQQLEKIVFALCEDTNTALSKRLLNLLKKRSYREAFAMKVTPGDYLNAEDYFRDVSCVDFLRKLPLDIPGVDREQIALDNFWLSERQCCRTNVRLDKFLNNGPLDPVDGGVIAFIGDVRKILSEILGSVPRDLTMRFGPGASFECRGKLTTVPDKISTRPLVTQSAMCLLPFWEETQWAKARLEDKSTPYYPDIVRGNRFTTVPKDWSKDRGICIEPLINLGFQLAVGSHLKDRLKLAGIDLFQGQDLHKALAQHASVMGDLATIDLSNASDTVSAGLVKLLLPEMWFDLLDSLRSPFTLVGGHWVKLEKFSSMGNGFTFELETLIFASLAKAVCDRIGNKADLGAGVWVYGDDIIVPTDSAHSLLSCLSFFGFTPNASKTFVSGAFRESCGGDFFHGVPVRAFQLKEFPHEPQHYIALANGLRRVAFGHHPTSAHLGRFMRSWLRSLDPLPNRIRRLRGPISLGDLVIHDRSWPYRETTDGRAKVRTYAPVSKSLGWRHWKPGVILASAVYGEGSKGPTPRGSVDSYSIQWRAVLERPPVA